MAPAASACSLLGWVLPWRMMISLTGSSPNFLHTSRIAVSVPDPKRLIAIFFPLRSLHLVIPLATTKLYGSVLTMAAMMTESDPWVRAALVDGPELIAHLTSPAHATW